SLNVFKLAHPDVVSDLRYLINAARREGTPATKSNLNLKRSGSRRVFGIKVVPLRVVPPSKERYYSIFFEETLAPPLDLAPKQRGEALSKRKQRIEHRDHTAQDSEYQQQLIEEYETTQEELISSNEELQSTNEELQSTNEVLETAKEELQSANEEM